MDAQTLERLRKRLLNRWPLIGPRLRRSAVAELAADATAEAVPLLVAALDNADASVAGEADAALRGLRDAEAIDALCARWVETRAGALAAIIRARKYVARNPVKVRVLSGLLAGAPADEAEAVPELVAALDEKDAALRQAAEAALRGLRDAGAIDALCARWVETRAGALAAIIRGQKYVARQPVKVRVLSGLLAGASPDDLESVPELVAALDEKDATLKQAAEAAVGNLRDRESVDALCRIAVESPDSAVARLCLESGKRPRDHEQACLFLFVTRQLDAYFSEDSDFQALRPAYDRASPAVQARVMEIVRSGDRRCLGFFGRRKPLNECSDEEIALAVESATRHQDWPRVFRAFLELPPKYGFPLLATLRGASWEPAEPDLKALLRGALAESDAEALPQPEATGHSSSVFERWLAEGRTGDLVKLDEAALLDRLAKADPPDGVKIVAALATKASQGGPASRAVKASEHWLVRLAGYATGLVRADLGRDSVQDGNYWVKELVGAGAVLDFWPSKATPADLDALNAAPSEAFLGRYGAVRRVLRLLLAHRVTAPEMEEVVFEAGEFAGTFNQA